MKYWRAILALCLLLFPLSAGAQFYMSGDEPPQDWMKLTTEHFIIIYPVGYSYDEVLKYAEALERYTPVVGVSSGMEPGKLQWGKTPVLLHARTNQSNGSVAWAPKRMDLYTHPEADAPLSMSWIDQLAVHELRHVSQMQLGYRGIFKPINYIVGEMWNGALAGVYSDKAILEGDAVVAETALSQSGRGREAAFMEYYRTAFRESDWRNWYRWRYGSYKYPAPDHYALGYMWISGMRYFYDIPDYTDRYYDFFVRNPWPFGKLGRTTKRFTGLKFKDAFGSIMEKYDSLWRAEELSMEPFTEGRQLTPEPRLGTDFNFLAMADDRLYSVMDGKASASTLVCIDKDGTAKRIRPFSSRTGKLVVDDTRRRIYWSEKLTDRRWSMAGNTIIRYFEFDTPERQFDLTSEGRLYNPAPSPDGNTVAATSYPVDGGSRLVVLSADDGSVLWESVCPGFQLTESAWHNGLIYGLGIADSGGFGIWSHPADGPGEWTLVLEPSFQQVEDLADEGDYLTFTSDRNHLQQMYAFYPETGVCEQLSNVPGGGTEFLQHGDSLLYISQTRLGRMVFKGPLDAPRPAVYGDVTPWEIPDALGEQEKALAISSSASSVISSSASSVISGSASSVISSEVEKSIEPYYLQTHALRFQSWAPIWFDYDEISSFSGDFSFSMASPGITGVFQNTMGNLYGFVGYSAHPDAYDSEGPWRHSGHLKLNYSGFFPVIEANLSFNDHAAIQYGYQLYNGDEPHTTGWLMDTPNFTASVSAWLPLYFNKGGYLKGLIPKVTYGISNNRLNTSIVNYDKVEGFETLYTPLIFKGAEIRDNVQMQSFAASLRGYVMESRGESQPYPRYGIGAETGVFLRPGIAKIFSPSVYGYMYGYLPGFTQVQGLRLNLLGEYLFMGENMFSEIRVNCAPRGFSSSVADFLAEESPLHLRFGADYAIPIYAGDIAIWGSVAYIKNFLLIPHTDVSFFGPTFLGSAGFDFTAELATLLTLPFEGTLGFELDYLYGPRIPELRENTVLGEDFKGIPLSIRLIFNMDI
jgi:hypothetical protein